MTSDKSNITLGELRLFISVLASEKHSFSLFFKHSVQIHKLCGLFFVCFLLSKRLKREIILIVDQQGQHLSILFSTTQRFIHVTWTHTCDFRESLKQNRPPADILDQTVGPFRVKNGFLVHCGSIVKPCLADPPAGLLSVKGTCAQSTDRERKMQGWESVLQSFTRYSFLD